MRRHVAAEIVPVLQRERHARPAGDGEQVQDGVGRAADRAVHPDGVLERGARQELRDPDVLLDQLNDAAAGQVRLGVSAGVHGRNRRVVRERQAERFDHARHGRRRAHHVARPARPRHARLGLHELLQAHRAGLDFLAEPPDVGARAELRAAVLAVEHRPARHDERRQVAARRAHDERRRGLVAAAQQHDAVDRVRRGSTPRRPCWPDCGRASRSGAGWSRRATSRGTRTARRPPPRRRA